MNSHTPQTIPDDQGTAGLHGPRLGLSREQITSRRGITGRWYKADDVDRLLDMLTGRLAAVMTDRDRLQRDFNRLADIDHARRHGALPTGMPVEPVDPDAVERRVREQEAVDRMLDDAARQAAQIIADARQQYLHSGEQETTTAGGLDHSVRADRAEARLHQVTGFLEQWTSYLTEREEIDQRASAQRATEISSARRAALAMLADLRDDRAR